MSKVFLMSEDRKIRHANKPIEERGKLIFETERDLEVYDVIKNGDEFYCVNTREYKTDSVGVDKINFNINPEETIDDDFICPYCRYKDDDSFEYGEEDETYCSRCGSTLKYERVGCNFNIEPIFPTSIIVND